MWVLVILALATASTTMTLVKSNIFRGLRERLSRSKFLGELVNCTYCTSHYVAMFYSAIFAKQILPFNFWVSWIVVTMGLVAISSPIMYVIYISHARIPPRREEDEA